jgi:transcriptional regulator with XRE-family HTH domain
MNKRRESIDVQLGDTIRSLRIQKGLKIKDVAADTGLTSSLISQVERAIIAPSVETLKKIAASLGVPVSYFFVDATEETESVASPFPTQATRKVSPVVHPHERKLLSPGKGTTFYLLNPDLSGPIEFIYNVYEPGSNTGRNQYSHPGFECGLILSGELLITIEDETYLLKEGDSITFDSNRPHSKSNISDKPCTCVWANNPPWF